MLLVNYGSIIHWSGSEQVKAYWQRVEQSHIDLCFVPQADTVPAAFQQHLLDCWLCCDGTVLFSAVPNSMPAAGRGDAEVFWGSSTPLSAAAAAVTCLLLLHNGCAGGWELSAVRVLLVRS
jgi:hypothetical protein